MLMETTALTPLHGSRPTLPITRDHGRSFSVPKRHAPSQRSLLRATGYYKKYNGISHATLTERAYARLVKLLGQYDNRLNEDHRTALYALVGAMTRMAQGQIKGRWAFGLPTGMGKTTAIVAWIAALHELGLDHVSVAVSAAKVEALCDLKRALMKEGLPPEKIGLVHSYKHAPSDSQKGHLKDGYASEPSDGAVDRQIMLVSHARVRDANKLNQFSHHKGKPRNLLVYDESLIVSDSVGIPVPELRGAIGWLAGKHDGNDKYADLIQYLTDCQNQIAVSLQALKDDPHSGGITKLPSRDEETLQRYRALLGKHPAVGAAHQLLDIATEQVRVIPTGKGGLVWYQVSVPTEIKNVFILDASYPIRKLVQLDPSIKNAEKLLPEISGLGKPLSQTKRFDNVVIHQMFSGGGRITMHRDFSECAERRRVTKEVAEVVRRIPDDEAVLVFVFKQRPTDPLDYRTILLRDLEAAGIDIDQTIQDDGKTQPRITVQTWGNETATNEWNYCKHVILVGVLQRSLVDLTSAYLGQVDNLQAEYEDKEITTLVNSEVCHTIYQALSRGSCRKIENGQAKRMNAYLIHRTDAIRRELNRVMPGVTWKVWEKTDARQKTGVEATTALRIEGYLSGLPEGIKKVSSRELKRDAGLQKVATRTFTVSLNRCLERLPGWEKRDRSVVRRFAGEDFA